MTKAELQVEDSTGTTLNELFPMGQIRLAELSVYNWGSFHGRHTVKINPEGTLVTGDNGSGKSTLIDGLMALLLPAGKAQFNVAAAQGDKTDRSLLSYIRGAYGTGHDGTGSRVMSKREGAVCTGLRALYRADDGSEITLAALFFVQSTTRSISDVSRIYVVGKRNLSLGELLDSYGEGNRRELKLFLKSDPALKSFESTFSSYQEYYSKLLQMENRNAPNLLSRALGLKKIDDLTDLIRDLVLEPSTIKDDGRKIVEEFSDLVGIHQELQDALEQSLALENLPEVLSNYQNAEQRAHETKKLLENVEAYIGEASCSLWSHKVERLSNQNKDLKLLQKQQQKKKEVLDEQCEARHRVYIEKGGKRVEELKQELKKLKENYSAINSRASRYQAVVNGLGYSDVLQEKVFLQNVQNAKSALESIGKDSENAQNLFGTLTGKLINQSDERNALQEDIREIERRPGSAIDPAYQRLKNELIESLGVDPEEFVFVGELIDVKKSETMWQGSIERALGGKSTTLLVPPASRSMVSKWLNARHTGLYVRVDEVNDKPRAQANFKSDGYLKKLEWKDHPYRDWLKHQLARFDLSCVKSTAELDVTEFSMTREGLIRKERGRLEKNDRRDVNDRRYWNIGFSNELRLSQLRESLANLDREIDVTNKKAREARDVLDSFVNRKSNLDQLISVQWNDIDVGYTHDMIMEFNKEIELLESADNDLYQLELLWEEAKESLRNYEREMQDAIAEVAVIEDNIKHATRSWEEAKLAASAGLEDWVREALSREVSIITADMLDALPKIIVDTQNRLQNKLDSSNDEKSKLHREATRIMASYRAHEKWRVIAEDWGSDIDSADNYINHYQYLVDDGLPALKDSFLKKLNQDSTQSLASLRQRLQSEHEDIRDRVDTINDVLVRTEFRDGTYLQLVALKEEYAHVKVFNSKVTGVLSQATSSEPMTRFDAVKEVVTIIEKAAVTSPNTMESQQLLDPRHQLRFVAHEIRKEDKVVIDTLSSSSGKSGGEKESFAGIIVAASLAYVLTPEGYDKPVYSTVFLDEAFSNTSELVSRRVLRVFRELKIHINLITPYKNLNIARESARSLLIAERNSDTHESHFLELTWEELDDHIRELEEQKLRQDAENLGITLGAT